MAEYKYNPLSGPNQIRLLLLNPGRQFDRLSCSLQTASIEDAPDFEALSYVWGKPSSTRSIVCADKTMRIRPNLYTAIWHLRHPDRPRLLWADAICINQNDIPERNQQVRVMGNIYSKAKKTLIWLGGETEDVKNSFELIRLSLILWPRDGYRPYGNKSLFTKLVLQQFQPVRALMAREWFTRKWVIQEVVKAREAVVICGFKTIPWDAFAKFASVLEDERMTSVLTTLHGLSHDQKHWGDRGNSLESIVNVLAIANLRQGSSLQLLNVLQRTHYFTCTDLKDSLYAVLGLADDITTNHCDFRIDYSQSIQQILMGLSKWFILEKKSLKFLHLVSGPMGSLLDLLGPEVKFVRWLGGMPSWVLDLTTKTFPYMPTDAPFSASGSSNPRARISPDGKILYITGKIIDRIQVVGGLKEDVQLPLPPWIRSLLQHNALKINSKLFDILQTLKPYRWVEEFRQMVLGGSATLSTRRFEEFSRTLVCDMSTGRQRASADITGVVDKYIKVLAELESKILSVHRSGLVLDVIDYINNFDDKRVSMEKSVIYSGIEHFSQYGRFCITQEGRLGCTQEHANPGDLICVFYGGNVPFLLRPRTYGGYELLGPTYVHGVMDGEALRLGIADQEFDIY